MKLILIAIFLLLIVTAYLVFPIVKALMNHMTMAETKPYEQQGSAIKILVAGDSTGVGTGASDSKDSIAGRTGQELPEASITNISENGLTLSELSKKLAAHSESGYDLVVLQIGANDVVGMTSMKNVAAELNRVLDQAEEKSNKVMVLTAGNIGLCPIFRWPLSALITARTLSVRKIFMNAAGSRENVEYVDLFENAKDDVFNTDIPKYYAKDRFHPSSDGYGVWFLKVRPVLKQIISK